MTGEINGTQQNQPSKSGSNGLSIAAMVLGIVAIVLTFIPILNNIGIFIGIVAIVLGAVGKSQASKRGQGAGLAITGLVLGILSVVLTLVLQAACSAAIDSAIDSMESASAHVEQVVADVPSDIA